MSDIIVHTKNWIIYCNEAETIKEHALMYEDILYADGGRESTLLITGQKFSSKEIGDSITTLFKCFKAAHEYLELMYDYKNQSGFTGVMQAWIGDTRTYFSNMPENDNAEDEL